MFKNTVKKRERNVIKSMVFCISLLLMVSSLIMPLTIAEKIDRWPIRITDEGYGVYRFEEFIRYFDIEGKPRFYKVNVYVINTSAGLVLIDAGAEQYADNLYKRINSKFHNKEILAVLLTHAHADHAGGGRIFQNKGYPVYIHGFDAFFVSQGMNVSADIDPQFIYTGYAPNHYTFYSNGPSSIHPSGLFGSIWNASIVDGLGFDILLTPGHTPGHVSIIYTTNNQERILFTGDTTMPYSEDDLGNADLTYDLDYYTLLMINATDEIIPLMGTSEQLLSLLFLISNATDPLLNSMIKICPGHNIPYQYQINVINYLTDSFTKVFKVRYPSI